MKCAVHPSRRAPRWFALSAMLFCLAFAGKVALAASVPHADLHRLLACRTISADVTRLKCFDAAAAALARTGSGARSETAGADTRAPPHPTRAAAAAVPAPPARESAAFDPRKTFGLNSSAIVAREVAAGVRKKSVSSITERVTGLGANPDGRVIYRLANGQVWEELVADGEAPPVKTGETVQISRGWLGSYWLQTASKRGCKVMRLH